MKVKIVVALALLALVVASCKKEEDLNTKIVRGWKIDKYYGGGVDSTVFFNYPFGGYTIDIKDDGNYTERYTFFGSPRVVNGTWSFLSNGAYFKQQDSVQTRVFTVLSIETDYMKLKNPEKNQEYWLKPNQ